MGALGFVLMLLEFPLPFIIPPFIKLDFSEIPAIITAYAFGPQYGILVCLIKNLAHLPFTFVKGMIDTAVCFAVYKRISPILKH